MISLYSLLTVPDVITFAIPKPKYESKNLKTITLSMQKRYNVLLLITISLSELFLNFVRHFNRIFNRFLLNSTMFVYASIFFTLVSIVFTLPSYLLKRTYALYMRNEISHFCFRRK